MKRLNIKVINQSKAVDISDLETSTYNSRNNNKKYFLKRPITERYLIAELIGEQISKYMDLPTIEYQLAVLDGKLIGLISKNFKKPNHEYVQSYNLTKEELSTIRESLTSANENSPLHDELARYLMRNLYSVPRDLEGNVLCERTEHGLRIATLYDYEVSLFLPTAMELSEDNLFRDEYGNYICMSFEYIANLLNLNPRMKPAYERIMDFNMERTIDIIENQHEIILPTDTKADFCNFDKRRKKFILDKIRHY